MTDDPITGKPFLEPPSTFHGVLDAMLAREAIDPGLASRLTAVREYLDEVDDTPRPFLTVLLRTQGRRIEPLKDALLCLSAQTDTDFEVIVLEHDAFEEDAAAVKQVIARLEPEFAARVRLLEVQGGTRAKPLNVGVLAAKGQYIAVYDDDDVLFANWVESFRAASHGDHGRLLRAVVATQTAAPELWPQDQDGFRTTSWPKAEYPDHFDLLQHLLVNYSPFMSWAFPRSLFFTYGLRFDEQLTVCEDWDVILRGSLICGVDDAPHLTSIYRRWEGGEYSYTKHSTEEWRVAEQRVIDRINSMAITMPVGSMGLMRGMVHYNTALDNYRFMFSGTSLRPPLHHVWNVARPGVKLAVRARNVLRRLRRRNHDSP